MPEGRLMPSGLAYFTRKAAIIGRSAFGRTPFSPLGHEGLLPFSVL